MSTKNTKNQTYPAIFENIDEKSKINIEFPGKKKKWSRKVISRSNHRCTEKFPSWKMKTMLPCESLLERNTFTIFDVAPKIKSVLAQPAKIEFHMDGEKRVHYPDALITTDKGRTFVEIKYSDDAFDPEVEKRSECLRRLLPPYGYTYEVLTELSIHQEPRLSNARYLHRNGWRKVSNKKRNMFIQRYVKKGYVLWGDVLSNNVPPLNHSQVCNLIIDGYLKIPMMEDWDETTRVTFIND